MATHARIEPPPAKPPRGNATTERAFSHAAPEHSDEETPPRGPRRRPNAMPTRDNRGSNAQRRTRARKPDRPRAGGPPRAPATPGANDSDPEVPVGARNCPGPDRFPEMLRVRETGRRRTQRRVAGGGDMVSPCLRASRTGGLESGATRTRISLRFHYARSHFLTRSSATPDRKWGPASCVPGFARALPPDSVIARSRARVYPRCAPLELVRLASRG